MGESKETCEYKSPPRTCRMLILFLLFKFHSIGAVPIPLQAEPSSQDDLSKRSLYSIIYNCFSTIFICVWVSVHPNIPPRQCGTRALWRQLKLMAWSLIAPEMVLVWAVKQWFAASRIRDTYNEGKGTNTTRMFDFFDTSTRYPSGKEGCNWQHSGRVYRIVYR
jgi:hypothetical protein